MKKSIYSRQQTVLLQLLIELRQASGISQTSLATLLGISQSEVSKHERGERGLDFLQLRHWLSALAMPIEAFVEIFESELSRRDEMLFQAGTVPTPAKSTRKRRLPSPKTRPEQHRPTNRRTSE